MKDLMHKIKGLQQALGSWGAHYTPQNPLQASD